MVDAKVASWVLRFRRRTAPRQRLFCLPYAGGGAAIYRSWTDRIGPDVEVCPVRLPGREARLAEPPFTAMDVLVPTLAEALAPLLDVPFALFGHSMGAFVAFELARELRRRGARATRLFVSGARAPHRSAPDPPVRDLSDAEFVAEVRRRYDAIPGAVLENAELIQLLLPCLRADFRLFETYVCRDEPPLACPISCFGGRDDDRVTPDDLEAWSSYTTGPYTRRMFRGSHFFLHEDEESVLGAVAEAQGVAAGEAARAMP